MNPESQEHTGRLRLLIVGRSLTHQRVGGIVYVSRQLLAHLDGRRFDVRYFANGAGRGGVGGGALRLLTLPVDLVRAWRYLRSFEPDVVHINTSLDWRSLLRDSCYVVLAGSHCDRVVLFIHGWRWALGRRLQTKRHPLRWFCRRLFARARHLVVLSHSFAKALEALGVAGDRLHVVPNPVDCDAFPRPAAATRPGTPAEWRLLFMARWVVEKGIYELVDAVPGIRDSCDRPVRLILAGDGPEREGVRRRCRQLGLDEVVAFPGYVAGDAKTELLESAHLFVFPSHREALPIVLLEAMAAGLPLVSTAVGAIGEYVRDGEHGVLLPRASAEDIKGGVLSLLRDPRRVAEVGMGNRRYARTRFDSAQVARTMEAIYQC